MKITAVRKSPFILAILLLFSAMQLFPQGRTYGRGAILNTEGYNRLTLKGIVRGEIPAAASLKQYAPAPGYQGDTQTCASWATAYAARTILESKALGRTSPALTTANAFSPVFVYRNIPDTDPDGTKGTAIYQALEVLKKPGVPKKQQFEDRLIFSAINAEAYRESEKYPIADYRVLFYINESFVNAVEAGAFQSKTERDKRLDPIKHSIAEGKPVILGMNTPDSLFYAGSRWISGKDDRPYNDYGGHAVCVVGYDDAKYGGAFEILNSWSEEWGDRGYTWIDYDTFSLYVWEAYEVIDDPGFFSGVTEHNPLIQIEIQQEGLSDAGILGANVRLSQDGYYKTEFSFLREFPFRFLLRNNKSEYVYVFAFDQESSKTIQVYPPEGQRPKALDTGRNRAVILGDQWLQIPKLGADVFVVLVSTKEQNIASLRQKFERGSGPPLERLHQAGGKELIPFDKVTYNYSSMQFSADIAGRQSKSSQSVAGFVLAVSGGKNGSGDDMVRIQGGSFGSGRETRQVEDFYMGSGEVTVGEFRQFVEAAKYITDAEKANPGGPSWKNPPFTQSDTHPVVYVSWFDAINYCNWRSEKDGLTPAYTIEGRTVTWNQNADGYRLPTEAEWEYAYTKSGAGITATRYGNPPGTTTPVKQYDPGSLDLYNLDGNVREWIWDSSSPGGTQDTSRNPLGIRMTEDSVHIIRGESWILEVRPQPQSNTGAFPSSEARVFLGFRIVRNVTRR
ncbi:MAG: SUMF1/EgtB/PvdO family nonheme iron enzyme [Treponema sp.]|jgi:formylglycine-generating enzyme required for sulfatase activity|nr:SUMF1/EgtB/PvdO family nonheme iron enzyme [Treponema sp.]